MALKGGRGILASAFLSGAYSLLALLSRCSVYWRTGLFLKQTGQGQTLFAGLEPPFIFAAIASMIVGEYWRWYPSLMHRFE